MILTSPNDVHVGSRGEVRVLWDTTLANNTPESERHIKASAAKYLGVDPSQIVLEKKVTNPLMVKGDGENNVQENIRNIECQHRLYKQFLEDNHIEEVNFEDIVKIDSRINTLVDYEGFEKTYNYTIKWIKWDNFLSYGEDNFIDFTKLEGLVLLAGEPANKCGKTTFAYDLVHFLLFGKTTSGKADRLALMFNNYRPDVNEVNVEGCLEVNGEDLIIHRVLTRSKSNKEDVKQSIEFYKVLSNGDRESFEDNQNLQGESVTKTNKLIRDIVGSEADFDEITSANMTNLTQLIGYTANGRGNLLTDWLGLNIIDKKYDAARKTYNGEIIRGRFCDRTSKEEETQAIEMLEQENKDLETELAEIDRRKGRLETDINNAKKERDDLFRTLKPVDSKIANVDVTTLVNTINQIIKDGKKVAGEIQALEEEYNSIGEVSVDEDRYHELQAERGTLYGQLLNARTQMDYLKNHIKVLEKAEICPTCGQKLVNVDNSEAIASCRADIEKYVEDENKLTNDIAAIDTELGKLKELVELHSRRSKLETQIETKKFDKERLGSDYKEKNRTYKTIKENEEAIEYNNRINLDITNRDQTIKTLEGSLTNLLADRINKENAIKTNNATIDQKKIIIASIENELKIERDWKVYLQIIGPDGIRKVVLREQIPLINNVLENTLSDVADFNVIVNMNSKNDVDFLLERNGVRSLLSAASGLERTQAALALRFVLGQISTISKPPFIIIDEVLGGVARENYDAMKKLFDKIAEKYDFVLHIAHIPEIADWHQQTITIEKIDNISHLKGVL